MDTLRQKILTIIEKNSRIDMRELAVLLGTGEIEVLNAMQEMQEEGIICGYHTMIDWEKTGIERVTALIEVRVTPQRGKGFDDIAERNYKYPEAALPSWSIRSCPSAATGLTVSPSASTNIRKWTAPI